MVKDNDSKDLFDSSGYAMALAGVLTAFSGAFLLLANKQAKPGEFLLHLGWGYAAIGCLGAAAFSALWSLLLYLAHRHNRRVHGTCPNPSAHLLRKGKPKRLTTQQQALIPFQKELELLIKLCPIGFGQSPTSDFVARFTYWYEEVRVHLREQSQIRALKHFESSVPQNAFSGTNSAYQAVSWRKQRFDEVWEMLGEQSD